MNDLPVTQSPEIGELAKALAAAQAELSPVIKDVKGQVGNQKYLYADLTDNLKEIYRVLPKHGLSVSQAFYGSGVQVGVATTLLHVSGQWMRTFYMAEAKDKNPQTVGSVVTYIRRYQVCAMVGLSADDDDGAAAQASAPSSATAQASAPAPAQAPEPPRARPKSNERYYFPSKQDHRDWLAGELTKRKIPRDIWDEISKMMDGKARDTLDSNLLASNEGVPF